MKSTVLALFFVAAASLSFAADQPSIGGKWQVHSVTAGMPSDQTCTLTQKESEFTGTCEGGQNPAVKISGKVDGKKVTWSFKGEYNGTPFTMEYTGTLEGSKISGTTNVPEFSVGGEFTATQAN